MSEFEWVAVALVSIFSAARITRLFTWDSYPPAQWLRDRWDSITNEGPWALLMHCGYCFGLYAATFVVGWGYVSDWHWTWWVFNGVMAVGYLAAIVMAFDGEDA